MDTKKMRWVSGNSVIEMSYIMPLFFSLFVIIIHTVFYYHDKAIIGGAAAESAVMGAPAYFVIHARQIIVFKHNLSPFPVARAQSADIYKFPYIKLYPLNGIFSRENSREINLYDRC